MRLKRNHKKSLRRRRRLFLCYCFVILFHHNLLGLHIIVIDEAKHVDTAAHIDGLVEATIDGLGAEDTARQVDHLEGGYAFVGDDEFIVGDKGEAFTVTIFVFFG